MIAEKKYRLEWFNEGVLAIDWAGENGDCYVRAILEQTDAAKFVENKQRPEGTQFSEPMTIDDARYFVGKNWEMLGRVRDCVGLRLEDENRQVLFRKPVLIQTL